MSDLLEQLQGAVDVGDWAAAEHICIELALAARSSLERERVDEIAKAVQLQDAGRAAAIVDELRITDLET